MFPKREFEKFPIAYVRMFQLKGVLEFPPTGEDPKAPWELGTGRE